MTDEELLFDLYYNKHNYDNANILNNKAKIAHPQIKRQFVKDWLNKQQAKQQMYVNKRSHGLGVDSYIKCF